MYLKHYPSILLVLLVTYTSFGQMDRLGDLRNAHAKFFSRERENFHLHLNKTVYIPGEKIWFKAYVLDQNTQRPSLITSNLNVGLYDKNGTEIRKKLVLVEEGTGYGEFAIDSVLTDSIYYLKAYTNWMKNFSKPNSFVEKIHIKRSAAGPSVLRPDSSELEVAFYPESGHIVSNARNTIAFQIPKTYNKGDKYKLSLTDEKGELVVSDIKYSDSGLGKFTYYHTGNGPYKLTIQSLDGKKNFQQLPTPKDIGISWSISNMDSSGLMVEISTNSATLSSPASETYYLSIHQNDFLKVEPLQLTDSIQKIKIPKDALMMGINTLTLFNADFMPVARRLVYSKHATNPDALTTEVIPIADQDSLEVRLKINQPEAEVFSLSISALPAANLVYKPTNSILSSFRLMPYVDQPVEDPYFFFEAMDRSKFYQLDLELITQGWGSYNWDTIFQDEYKDTYDAENGIEISGKIKDADLTSEKTVWMYSEESGNMIYSNLDRNKDFITQAVVYEGDSLGIALSDNKGELRKPEVELMFRPEKTVESLGIKERRRSRNSYFDKIKSDQDGPGQMKELDAPLAIEDNTVFLEEVELVQRRKVENRMQNTFVVAADAEARIISDEDIRVRKTVTNYLRRLGFRIMLDGVNVRVVPRIPSRSGGTGDVAVFIDGMPAEGNDIFNMPLHRVRSLTFDPERSAFISINTRFESYFQNDKKGFVKFLITNGFASPQEFKNPIYRFSDKSTFEYYGTIDWEPVIQLESNQEFTYRIPNEDLENIRLYIEGMGSAGTIISETVTLRLD